MDKTILTTDEKGYGLSRQDLIDRITLYDVFCLKRGINAGDFDWSAKIMTEGHKGLDQRSDDELAAEWGDVEEGFWMMIEDQAYPYMLDNDPMDYDPHQAEMEAQDV